MELIRKELKFYIPAKVTRTSFSETTDIIIPDSYPDFDEPVFSSASINVKDELHQPSRILISGQFDAVILYRSLSHENYYRLNVPLSFAHVENQDDAESNAPVFMRYDIAQVDVRIINSRKISVSCTCIITSRAFTSSNQSLTTDVRSESHDLYMRYDTNSLNILSAAAIKQFVILDDIEYTRGAELAPLHTRVDYGNVDCTVSNGRLILNGSAKIQIWETDEANSICHHSHNIPFHQILEIEGLSEQDQTQIQLSCHSVICHYANNETLSVNINTEALLLQESTHEITHVNDLYSLNMDVKPVFQSIPLCVLKNQEVFTANASVTFALPHIISAILSTECTVCSILCSESESLKCLMHFSILYKDDLNNLHQLQKQQIIQLQSDKPISSESVYELTCSTEPVCQGAELTLSINAKGGLLECEPFTISNLEKVLISPLDSSSHPPIRILFIREPTSLWEIAKANRSTTKLIAQYNELTEDTLEVSHKKLLIP